LADLYSGRLTHISGHPLAAGRAWESSQVKDRCSTTVQRSQLIPVVVAYSRPISDGSIKLEASTHKSATTHAGNVCLQTADCEKHGKINRQTTLYLSQQHRPRGRDAAKNPEPLTFEGKYWDTVY